MLGQYYPIISYCFPVLTLSAYVDGLPTKIAGADFFSIFCPPTTFLPTSSPQILDAPETILTLSSAFSFNLTDGNVLGWCR